MRSQVGRSSSLERCHPYLDALWFLACLSSDDDTAAERAVLQAVTAAAATALAGAREAGVWATLAQHVERAGTAGGPAPDVGPNALQRQSIALIRAGLRPCQVAALLGVPLARVHQDLRTGLTALRSRDQPPRSARLAAGGEDPGVPGPAPGMGLRADRSGGYPDGRGFVVPARPPGAAVARREVP